jgi:hypothetical protein
LRTQQSGLIDVENIAPNASIKTFWRSVCAGIRAVLGLLLTLPGGTIRSCYPLSEKWHAILG